MCWTFSSSKKNNTILIPKEISESETIVRGLFYPKFFKSGTNLLHPNAFRPANDEVSVLRLLFTTANFCKNHFKSMNQPSYQRNYYGMAVLDAINVYQIGAFFDDSQQDDLPMHTNIKFGISVNKGEPIPPNLRNKIDLLICNARVYKDPNPESTIWSGDKII